MGICKLKKDKGELEGTALLCDSFLNRIFDFTKFWNL